MDPQAVFGIVCATLGVLIALQDAGTLKRWRAALPSFTRCAIAAVRARLGRCRARSYLGPADRTCARFGDDWRRVSSDWKRGRSP